MIKRRIVDTNLIVRHLVQDHEKHAKAAGRLFAACDRGEIVVILLPVIFAECVFVLESFYKHARASIADALASLIRSPGIEMENPSIYLDALERYRNSKLHLVDCVLAASAVAAGVPVASFDADLSKFNDVTIELN